MPRPALSKKISPLVQRVSFWGCRWSLVLLQCPCGAHLCFLTQNKQNIELLMLWNSFLQWGLLPGIPPEWGLLAPELRPEGFPDPLEYPLTGRNRVQRCHRGRKCDFWWLEKASIVYIWVLPWNLAVWCPDKNVILRLWVLNTKIVYECRFPDFPYSFKYLGHE